MYSCPIQLDDVRYNAANQSFEALVTVHDNATRRSYACALPAVITTSFQEASEGLAKQAIALHQHEGASLSSFPLAPQARPSRKMRFDLTRWLRGIVSQMDHTTAKAQI